MISDERGKSSAEERMPHLIVFGLGYSGAAVARAAVAAGWRVSGTSRSPTSAAPRGVALIAFAAAETALGTATHLLATAAPDAQGDPVLARYAAAIRAVARPPGTRPPGTHLSWIGYLSSTGVYGDRGGAWVDEDTPPAPSSPHARRRLQAEAQWRRLADRVPLDIFRLAGIYGPGRSPFDSVRAGTARRIVKPGQVFGRIHRDDIALAVLAAMRQERRPGARVLNLADDEPAENAAVVEEAARLLGLPPPPAVPFEQAAVAMSDMGRNFWAENRRVCNASTKAALGLSWRYPSYREGLRAILLEESVQGAAQ
jgi:nucleoside-diphosphate-sugar epimerase